MQILTSCKHVALSFSTMKLVFTLFLAVILVEAHSDGMGEFSVSEKTCMKKNNLDEFMVDYNLRQLYMPENNIPFTKFITCVWKKDGFIDGKDNLVFEVFKNYIADTFAQVIGSTRIAEAFARDSVNSCKTVKGDSAGLKGIRFMNCVTRLYQN